MNNDKKIRRKTLGLDNRIWLALLILAIACGGILSYKITDKDDCTPFNIDAGSGKNLNDDVYPIGEVITFRASIPSQKILWNFNDGSQTATGAAVVSHKFVNEGQYYVTATSKPGCEALRLIYVTDPSKIVTRDTVTTQTPAKEIIGTASTFTDREEEFVSPVSAHSFHEWIVVSHPELGKSYNERARFRFTMPGRYIVQLTVDNDPSKRFTKQVIVEDITKPKLQLPEFTPPLINEPPPVVQKREEPVSSPVTPAITTPQQSSPPPVTEIKKAPSEAAKTTPAAPRSIRVADETFKNLLQLYVDDQMGESDFYKYLCGKGTTPVIINGNAGSPKTFSWLCRDVREKKNKKNIFSKKTNVTIQSVKMYRDEDDSKCVNKIEVRY